MNVKRISECQTKCTECCIAGGNRKDDDADQSDHTADIAESVTADDTGDSCCTNLMIVSRTSLYIGCLKDTIYNCLRFRGCLQELCSHHGKSACICTKVDHAHGAGCPAHSDEAFHDHHVVIAHPAVLLGLDRSGNQSGLGAVESGEDTAGNRKEEYRNEMACGEVRAPIKTIG